MAFIDKTSNIINRKINFSSNNINSKFNFIVNNKENLIVDTSNIIINEDLILNDYIYADGRYISNISWNNIILPSNINDVINFYVSSNILSNQNYINSNILNITKNTIMSNITSNTINIDILNNKIEYLMNVISDLKTSNNLI